MNASDCENFGEIGNFLQVIESWRQYENSSVTYLVVLDHSIPRLNDSSDILYIGYTENLGGENGRLWNYRYATEGNGNDFRIREYARRLVERGDSVSLRLCEQPPDGYSSHQYEGNLLKKFREEHWELPPWNSQG